MNEVVGNKLLIVGYGREGQATHRFLLSHYPDKIIDVADQKQITLIKEAPLTTKVHSGNDYLHNAGLYDTIMRSPGVVMNQSFTGKTSSATNLFFAHCPGKIIGVTGTKGKSTTSSLIAAFLRISFSDVRLAGNIGLPMLEHLENATKNTIFVLELSSFQLEDLNYSPHIGVILNIVPEHLDHHGTFEGYVNAKARISKFQSSGDFLVLNPHHSALKCIEDKSAAIKRFFSEREDENCNTFIESAVIARKAKQTNEVVVKIAEIQLKGPGNLQNVLAAITTASIFDIPVTDLSKAIANFAPLEHRLQNIGTYKDITFINDSLATIPEALKNALIAYSDEVDTVIVGGFDRGLNYKVAGEAISSSKVRNVIFFPTTGEKIKAATEEAGGNTPLQFFPVTSMEEAVEIAFQQTKKSSICLMSPASSSFNLFKDYKDRGEAFSRLVKQHGSS